MLNINEIMELSFVENGSGCGCYQNPEGYLQVTKYGYGRLEVKESKDEQHHGLGRTVRPKRD